VLNFKEGDLAGMKVLIVDDTLQNIDILGHILKQGGLSISVAPNAEIAQKVIEKDKPDLLLLDVMMPGMNGHELCEKLKADPTTEGIPIIFVTAMAETEDLVKGFELGGVDYIVKPFKEMEVLVRIKTHLSMQKLIKEKNELIQELDSLSRIDPLTGISNRRDIIEVLNNEQFRYDRYGKSFVVVMGDIDFFKKINDQFGHDTGDYILKGVADIIKTELRKVDFLARWGGEEFLLVLPETNLAGGAKVAESTRKAIQNKKFEFNGNEISVSMSLGVGCHTGEGMKLDELLKMADDRLYAAKERGRNQVVSI
jgi:two-component system, cell cycle response regulator